MWSSKCAVAICFLLLASGVRAEGFVLGFGVEGDSADGRAVSAFGDFGIGDDTWLTVLGSIADTEGIIRDNETLLAGIGLALKTKDEVEELAKEISKKGKLSEKEGKSFIEDLLKRYDEAQQKLEERVEQTVKELLKKADVVTGDELKGLKKEIRELKKMIKQSPEENE